MKLLKIGILVVVVKHLKTKEAFDNICYIRNTTVNHPKSIEHNRAADTDQPNQNKSRL